MFCKAQQDDMPIYITEEEEYAESSAVHKDADFILAKTIKELNLKRPRRKPRDTRRIHLVGKITDIMMGKITMQKYVDPGSPIVKTHINGIEIPNTLIDLGAAINIMSKQTMEQLKLPNLLFTPTLLQLTDRSVINQMVY